MTRAPNGTGAVITQWRDPETTDLCLQHLSASARPPRMIVVVDNESDERLLASQASRHPGVHFIARQSNEGHPAAVNAGAAVIMEHQCEFVFIMDNDALCGPESLGLLETALRETPEAAAVAPMILSGRRPGRVWFGGGRVSLLGNGVHENMWEVAAGMDRTPRFVSYAPSTALLVRASAFSLLGGFDASLHAYTDDLDFCCRAARAGLRLLYLPAAEVKHGESVNVIKVAGREFRDYYTMRNRLIVIRKHGSLFQKIPGIPLSILWHGLGMASLFLFRGEPRRAAALLRGIGDFFKGRTGRRDV